MIRTDRIQAVIRKEYPEATEDEVQEAAEKVVEKFRDALENVDGSDLQEEIANETPLERAERFDKAGIYGVMILSQRDEHACLPCLKHDGTQYTTEECQEDPPLPHDECENDECRCTTLPIPDREVYFDMLTEEPDLSNLPQFDSD